MTWLINWAECHNYLAAIIGTLLVMLSILVNALRRSNPTGGIREYRHPQEDRKNRWGDE